MEREPDFTPVPKNLQFRVGLLLGLTLVIAASFVIFVLYTRGAFEASQQLTLVADNAEGVSIGMDLTFSGFPVGRVTRIRLRDDGRALIRIRVPREDTRWLKTTTIFTLERGLVGGARIRAITTNLQDPPLPDGAERTVLRGDTQEEIPRIVATLRGVLDNLDEMTKAGGSLQASLANLRAVTEKMAGKSGALGAMLGSDEEARKVTAAIDRANASLKRLDEVLAKTDQRVFGSGGVMDGTQRAITQANAILGDARESLKKVDGILADLQQTGANTKAATTDLGALRAEVDAAVRRISGLIEEIDRKWPFERKTEIKLP